MVKAGRKLSFRAQRSEAEESALNSSFSILNSLFYLVLVMCLTATANAKYSGGSGTADDPYKIANVADLLALAADTGDYDKHFVLTTDIDLDPNLPGNRIFTTAVIAPDTDNSNYRTSFTGVFDGNGHTIRNLTIDANGSENDYLGLFGYLCLEGEIKNLGIENVSITGGDYSYCLGGLVGDNYEGTISNCYSTGVVTGGNNSYSLGGMAGWNLDGNISNCYSTAAVTGGDGSSELGGLVGLNDGNISNCYFLVTSGPDNGFGTPLTDEQMKQQAFGYDTGSLKVAISPKEGGCTALSPPTSVSASDGSDTNKVRVTWNSVSGATGYEVWHNTSNSSSSASKLGDYTSPFDDNSATPGTMYYYWVKAKNSCTTSGFSSSDSGYATCAAPSAPTGVSASDGNYTNKVRVAWDSVSGATDYEVWCSDSNNSSSASKLGNSTSPFDDSSVAPGKTYYYWVKAKNSCGTSDFNFSDSGYAYSCTAPSAPTSVSASDGTYTDRVRVTWNSVSGATGYEVWRSASNSSSSASKLGDYTSPFDDSGVTPGTTYYYWVKARNSCGTSDFSFSDSGYASSCAVPSSPAGVSATNGTYNDHIRVTWNSASGATGYEVWRNTSNNPGAAIKLGDHTSPYDNYGVTEGTTYYYWVKAKNSCGTSDFSSSDSGYASTSPPSYSISITKCTVTAGKKENSDKISFSGIMNATVDDFISAGDIYISIGSNDIICDLNFPIDDKTLKTNGYRYSGIEDDVRKSFTYDVKTGKFSFAASNIDLSGLGCPLTVEIEIGDYNATVEIDETTVNGTKPIPINLMMGVKNSLRVDKIRAKRGSSGQLSVTGGFAVANTDVNMADPNLVVGLASQIFTIPAGNFKETKNGFACSNVRLLEDGLATANFDFKRCIFTLAIKNAGITADAGDANFSIEFADFSESTLVALP